MLTVPVVILLAAAAILVGVVIVALGRGGEMASFSADHPPLDLGSLAATDVVLLRPPTSIWGYNIQVTDDALDRIARAMSERDVEIAALRQQVQDLRAVAPGTFPGAPSPAGRIGGLESGSRGPGPSGVRGFLPESAAPLGGTVPGGALPSQPAAEPSGFAEPAAAGEPAPESPPGPPPDVFTPRESIGSFDSEAMSVWPGEFGQGTVHAPGGSLDDPGEPSSAEGAPPTSRSAASSSSSATDEEETW
jgi:hypothetical protein